MQECWKQLETKLATIQQEHFPVEKQEKQNDLTKNQKRDKLKTTSKNKENRQLNIKTRLQNTKMEPR